MTLAESQAAKPMHIKVVIVEPGETVERFRVLNGLAQTDRVTPGDLMKIVVE